MDANRTYTEPVLVDLGDAVAVTLGHIDQGDEAFTMKLPTEDI